MTDRTETSFLRSEARRLRTDAQRKLVAASLKCCPLCGAVNALTNRECFVCRWHGTFSRDPLSVETALNDLLERCPELVDSVILDVPRRRTILRRFIGWIRSHFHRPLDIFA